MRIVPHVVRIIFIVFYTFLPLFYPYNSKKKSSFMPSGKFLFYRNRCMLYHRKLVWFAFLAFLSHWYSHYDTFTYTSECRNGIRVSGLTMTCSMRYILGETMMLTFYHDDAMVDVKLFYKIVHSFLSYLSHCVTFIVPKFFVM